METRQQLNRNNSPDQVMESSPMEGVVSRSKRRRKRREKFAERKKRQKLYGNSMSPPLISPTIKQQPYAHSSEGRRLAMNTSVALPKISKSELNNKKVEMGANRQNAGVKMPSEISSPVKYDFDSKSFLKLGTAHALTSFSSTLAAFDGTEMNTDKSGVVIGIERSKPCSKTAHAVLKEEIAIDGSTRRWIRPLYFLIFTLLWFGLIDTRLLDRLPWPQKLRTPQESRMSTNVCSQGVFSKRSRLYNYYAHNFEKLCPGPSWLVNKL